MLNWPTLIHNAFCRRTISGYKRGSQFHLPVKVIVELQLNCCRYSKNVIKSFVEKLKMARNICVLILLIAVLVALSKSRECEKFREILLDSQIFTGFSFQRMIFLTTTVHVEDGDLEIRI